MNCNLHLIFILLCVRVCRMIVCELFTQILARSHARTQASMNSLSMGSNGVMLFKWVLHCYFDTDIECQWLKHQSSDVLKMQMTQLIWEPKLIQRNAEMNERKNNAVIHEINDRLFSDVAAKSVHRWIFPVFPPFLVWKIRSSLSLWLLFIFASDLLFQTILFVEKKVDFPT